MRDIDTEETDADDMDAREIDALDIETHAHITAMQLRALEWLAHRDTGRWIKIHHDAPSRQVLDSLVLRGLAVRSAADAGSYRITARGADLSPPS